MRVGHIVEARGDMVRVSTSKRGPCEGCAEEGSCQPGLGPAGAILEVVEARNLAGARVGDHVELELGGHTELRVSLLVWIGPVVGLIAGAAMAAAWHDALGLGRDVASLLGAAVGVALTYGALMQVDKKAATDERLVPQVRRIRSELPTGTCSVEGRG